MTLSVDSAGLSGLQGMAARAAEDAAASRSYYDKHGHIGWAGEGIINLCRDTDDKMQRDVRAFLDKLGHEVLPGTAAALGSARDYYLRTDQASAGRMDASMSGADVRVARKDVDPIPVGPGNREIGRFADVCRPTDHLTEPPDFDVRMPFTPKWHDLASVGAVVRDAFWSVTWVATQVGLCDRPYDLLEIALKPICGDWAGMATVGYALKQVSAALLDMSTNLAWAGQCTPSAWAGNAADAATAYLYQVSKTLAGASVTLAAMGKEYASAAQGAFDFSDTVGSLIVEAADAAVTAAAAAGLTAAVGSSGAGLPLALVIGVFCVSEVRKVVLACREIVQIIGKLDALTSSLKASGDQFGRIDGDYPLPGLPAAPALPR